MNSERMKEWVHKWKATFELSKHKAEVISRKLSLYQISFFLKRCQVAVYKCLDILGGAYIWQQAIMERYISNITNMAG